MSWRRSSTRRVEAVEPVGPVRLLSGRVRLGLDDLIVGELADVQTMLPDRVRGLDFSPRNGFD
jgi:hypothetical protein